jgi:hypothetical protein
MLAKEHKPAEEIWTEDVMAIWKLCNILELSSRGQQNTQMSVRTASNLRTEWEISWIQM